MTRKQQPPKTTPVPKDAFVPGECLAGGSEQVIHWRGQTCFVYRVPIEDLPEHNARYSVAVCPDHPLREIMNRSNRWWPAVIYTPIAPPGPGPQTETPQTEIEEKSP